MFLQTASHTKSCLLMIAINLYVHMILIGDYQGLQ